ncbi:MAG: hypothetical protein OEX19_15180 [Gammaproteobacteria bacterium]|nr:hypothetical protein [Gammaproteobacteria bacterium]
MAMKTPFLACTLAALIMISGAANADVIHLADGSSINGEILSLKKGIYTVQSSAMGILKLRKSQVTSIDTGKQSFIANQYSKGNYAHINRAITSQPALQHSINDLNGDPLVQQILNDPELMSAIQNQDLSKLQNNPLILKLMNNPQMKAITQQLK